MKKPSLSLFNPLNKIWSLGVNATKGTDFSKMAGMRFSQVGRAAWERLSIRKHVAEQTAAAIVKAKSATRTLRSYFATKAAARGKTLWEGTAGRVSRFFQTRVAPQTTAALSSAANTENIARVGSRIWSGGVARGRQASTLLRRSIRRASLKAPNAEWLGRAPKLARLARGGGAILTGVGLVSAALVGAGLGVLAAAASVNPFVQTRRQGRGGGRAIIGPGYPTFTGAHGPMSPNNLGTMGLTNALYNTRHKQH